MERKEVSWKRHEVTAMMGVRSNTKVQGIFPSIMDVHQTGSCWSFSTVKHLLSCQSSSICGAIPRIRIWKYSSFRGMVQPSKPNLPVFWSWILHPPWHCPAGAELDRQRHVLEMSPSTAPDTAKGQPDPGVLSGAAGHKIRGWGGSQGDWAGKLRPIHAPRGLTINYFV